MCGSGGGGSKDALRYQQKQDRERRARIARGEGELERMFASLEGGRFTGDPRHAAAGMEYGEYEQAIRDILGSGTRQEEYIAGYSEPNSMVGEVPLYGSRKVLTNQGRQQLIELGLDPSQVGSVSASPYLDLYGSEDWYDNATQTSPIWEEHRQAYMDFANPQLDRQFGDAREGLTFALARQGQTQGSIAGERRADLETDYGERQQDVAQTGQDYANRAKQDLAAQKQNAYQMLTATANPGATTAAARSSLAALRDTPALTPLGTLFQNSTAGLAGAIPAYQQGQQNARVQNIIYSQDPNRGSGSVVR